MPEFRGVGDVGEIVCLGIEVIPGGMSRAQGLFEVLGFYAYDPDQPGKIGIFYTNGLQNIQLIEACRSLLASEVAYIALKVVSPPEMQVAIVEWARVNDVVVETAGQYGSIVVRLPEVLSLELHLEPAHRYE